MKVITIGEWVTEENLKLSTAWRNHPATRMWRDHRWALLCYAYSIVRGLERHHIETGQHRFNLSVFGKELSQEELQQQDARQNSWADAMPDVYVRRESFPWWLGHYQLHASHRSALLAKSPNYYGKFGWDEPPVENYYWPC
jgi:hypothetical protein